MKHKINLIFLSAILLLNVQCSNKSKISGTQIKPIDQTASYEDNRPSVKFGLEAKDAGIVYKHGQGPDSCDYIGARDIWVWEDKGTFYMHYDGAGPKGYLCCLAVSKDLMHWEAKGTVIDFGKAGSKDCATAIYGVTFFDGNKWHMFYVGSPNATPSPDFVAVFPYLTLKAEGESSTGPWEKRYDIVPFEPRPGTYYEATASPGHIIKDGNNYLMFFSASAGAPKIMRTISLARTNDLDGKWEIDEKPILPVEEQIENTSLYFEKSNQTWFMFTNHVGIKEDLEYTDAIWVYWSKDLNNWDPANKAVVIDSTTSTWSKHIIGLPSVVQMGNRLAVFYDGNDQAVMPQGFKSHMNRDIGLAWINLPIVPPTK